MAVFFLLIGLELERELYSGELSNIKNALLPMFAAVGGMVAPAAIHFALNAGTPSQSGIGIPMATDIAFALAVLAILGKRIPASLKVFVVAFAVMDDLGAIVIIAAVYTAEFSLAYLLGALAVWTVLVILNRFLRVMSRVPYLLGGAVMWYFMLQSGVHATIASVALAFAIPYSSKDEDQASPSHKLEHLLHKPVAFIVLPLFALANTGVVIGADWMQGLASMNSLGIAGGPSAGQAPGRRAAVVPRRGERPLPTADRALLAAHLRRRDSRWNRIHDVDLHHQSRLRRRAGGPQRFEDGDSPGVVDRGHPRLPLAPIPGPAGGGRRRSGSGGLKRSGRPWPFGS